MPPFTAAFPFSAPLALAVVAFRAPLLARRVPVVLTAFAALALVGFFLSASFNDTAVSSTSITFTASTALLCVGGSLVVRSLPDSADALAFVALGALGQVIVFGSQYSGRGFADFWKYGAALPCTLLALWVTTRLLPGRLAPMVLIAFGVGNLLLNSRSDALIALASGLFALIRSAEQGWTLRRAVIVALAVLGGFAILSAGLLLGLFGAHVRNKTLEQLSQGGFSLLSARTEPPLAAAAIGARPLLGWGDVNTISDAVVHHGQEIARSLGSSDPQIYMRYWRTASGGISVHSIFAVSWIEGGLLAVLWPLLLIVVSVVALQVRVGRWTALLSLTAVHLVWDLLFSPWVAGATPLKAVMIVMVVTAIRQERSRGWFRRMSTGDLVSLRNGWQAVEGVRRSRVPRTFRGSNSRARAARQS